MDVYAKLHEMLRAMKNRSAGGGDKSGRYKKADTARRHFILTRGLLGIDTALPSLTLGVAKFFIFIGSRLEVW